MGKFLNNESDFENIVLKTENEENKIESELDLESKKEEVSKEKIVGSIKLPSPPSVERPINVTVSIETPERDEIIEQIKHFSESLKNKPENIHEWIQLGNLRKAIGDYLGAIEYWKYASILEPAYHVPFNNLGNIYQYYLNDMEKAEEYFKKMIKVSPNNEESYRNLFQLYANSYKEKKDLARGVLEEGIKNVTHNENLKMMLENYKSENNISE